MNFTVILESTTMPSSLAVVVPPNQQPFNAS